nr:hypothetical protein B0A51_01462 [Rachicladosporium sp. CCFEE 5018]
MDVRNSDTLGLDVLKHVAQFLTQPSDLNRLAQVSNNLRHAARVELYRDVHIDLRKERKDNSFFKRNHHCHNHVRGIHLSREPLMFTDANEQCNSTARAALVQIPNHQLLRVTFPLDMAVDTNVLDVLYIQQRKITKLVIVSAAGALSEIFLAPDHVGHWRSDLVDLIIPNAFSGHLEQRDLRVWNRIIKGPKRKLRRLELRPSWTFAILSRQFLHWPVYPPQTEENISQPPAGEPYDNAAVALLRHEVWEYTRLFAWNVFLYHSLVTRPANTKVLRVVMIGTTNWNCYVDVAATGREYIIDDISSLTYVRRDQVDYDGVRSMVAVKVDNSAVEYDDRRYVMFDYGK